MTVGCIKARRALIQTSLLAAVVVLIPKNLGAICNAPNSGIQRSAASNEEAQGRLALPSPKEVRKARELIERGYDVWYGRQPAKVFDLLSVGGAKRNMFKGDRTKVIRTIEAWRTHVGETMHVPAKLRLSFVKSLSRRQAQVLAALMLSKSEIEKVRKSIAYLDGKFVLFSYRLGTVEYATAGFRSNGQWGLLNDPYSFEVPTEMLLR